MRPGLMAGAAVTAQRHALVPCGTCWQKSPRHATEQRMGEFWAFLRARKKWWLAPLLLFLLAFGALLIASQTSVAAPFIYSLF
jgi:hypothetical protein